jgi:hypothetical protein
VSELEAVIREIPDEVVILYTNFLTDPFLEDFGCDKQTRASIILRELQHNR